MIDPEMTDEAWARAQRDVESLELELDDREDE